jgi:hypothetical protein
LATGRFTVLLCSAVTKFLPAIVVLMLHPPKLLQTLTERIVTPFAMPNGTSVVSITGSRCSTRAARAIGRVSTLHASHTVRGFIESGEFKADKPALLNPSTIEEYNAEYVNQLYLRLLRRAPDSSGFATWFNHLNTTGDYSHVVHGFINASEYRLRFGPH